MDGYLRAQQEEIYSSLEIIGQQITDNLARQKEDAVKKTLQNRERNESAVECIFKDMNVLLGISQKEDSDSKTPVTFETLGLYREKRAEYIDAIRGTQISLVKKKEFVSDLQITDVYAIINLEDPSLFPFYERFSNDIDSTINESEIKNHSIRYCEKLTHEIMAEGQVGEKINTLIRRINGGKLDLENYSGGLGLLLNNNIAKDMRKITTEYINDIEKEFYGNLFTIS